MINTRDGDEDQHREGCRHDDAGRHAAGRRRLPPEGGPWPTPVTRLPYNKEIGILALAQNGFDLMRAVKAGYAVVVQDTRGGFASGGDFTPFVHEAADGADTIARAAGPPWSTGAVGMVGGSDLGAAQFSDGWTHQGGALQRGFDFWWARSVLLRTPTSRPSSSTSRQTAMSVADGILRARYRHSLSSPSPLRPDAVHELRIDLGATATVFAASLPR